MLPEIKLQGNVDVATPSPLLRGMLLSVAYADGEGGTGLTATSAMNRKFVHWAAVNFLWPDFTAEDLYSMNKAHDPGSMGTEIRYPIWRLAGLCWLGLRHEAREELTLFQDGYFRKTPLWPACLRLDSDTQSDIGVH